MQMSVFQKTVILQSNLSKKKERHLMVPLFYKIKLFKTICTKET